MADKGFLIVAILWLAIGLLFGIKLLRARNKKVKIDPIYALSPLNAGIYVIGAATIGPLWIPLIIWAKISDLFQPY